MTQQAPPVAAASVYDDGLARSYDTRFQTPRARYQDHRHARLLRPHVDGRSVLDLACGTGWLLDHLTPDTYLGIDASPGMLAQARRKHPDARFQLAPAQRLDQPAVWDTIVCLWAWPYFASPRVARRIHDALRPGGVALIQWWTPRHQPSINGLAWTPQTADQVSRQLQIGGLTHVQHHRPWPLANTRIARARKPPAFPRPARHH